MRKWLALTSALCLALTIAVPSVQAAPTSPFTGTWIGQDPPPPISDGSTMHLDIRGGTHARIAYIDEYASVCFRAGLPTYYTSFSVGTVSGDTLNATGKWAKCGQVPFGRGGVGPLFYDDQGTADLADDTLWDGWVFWYRD